MTEEKKVTVIELTGPPMPSEYNSVELTAIAEDALGHCARLISGSKSFYRDSHPDNIVFFNANVFTKEDGKIWFGDIDLTIDEEKLKVLDKELDKEVFLLNEMAGRFDKENKQAEVIESDAIWSSRRGLLNWFKDSCDDGKYKRENGKLVRGR